MNKTHFQVRDTRTNTAVPGAQAMMLEDNAKYVAQKLNRRCKKTPRYIILRVDPDNLPLVGTPYDPADSVSEF
jgi:hypothetical protein